jgi:hypothetical protein
MYLPLLDFDRIMNFPLFLNIRNLPQGCCSLIWNLSFALQEPALQAIIACFQILFGYIMGCQGICPGKTKRGE